MSSPNVGNTEQTGSPIAPAPADQQAEDQKPRNDANVTPQPSVDTSVVGREEKVEYRDQDGNLLEEDQVSSLAGQVSFKTRYETRTRVIDAAGNEIADGSAGAEGFAPPHPDVDREPETAADVPEDDGREYPATASPDDDVSKEKSVENIQSGKPSPASDASEATK